MNPQQNANENPFDWTDFDQLEELHQFGENLDESAIPDAAYRQLKDLNQALIRRACQLAEFESDLERQKTEFELARQSFEALRIQSTRESTEARLENIVKRERQSPVLGETEEEIDFIEILDPQLCVTPEIEPEVSLTHQTDSDLAEAPQTEKNPDLPQLVGPNQSELNRFQKSAQDLREKSEIISAVFVELDQMVHDLNRQQELLNELNIQQNSSSATELDTVNKKLRRRFRRLSKQIKQS